MSTPIPIQSSNGPDTHLRSLFNVQDQSAQALNLAGLLGRVKMSRQDEGEEVLLQPRPSRTIGRHTKAYVPSPTLSYYANFVPATPAPPPLPVPASQTATTSFAMHRSVTPPTRTEDRRIQRKQPPAPIDVERACGSGRKAQAMNRHLPVVITLDSPVLEDKLAGELGPTSQELAYGREDDTAPSQDRRGVKSLWRSKSRSKKIVPAVAEPSPEWVEVEQGYRHPSWMGGLDVHGIDLLKPARNDHVGSTSSPTTLTPSPGTGGVLHNVLLTPTYGGSTSRHRSPSPNHSSTNLLPIRPTNHVEDDCDKKKQKRRTLMDRAGRLLNEQRMRLVYDNHKRDARGQVSPVKVGGVVPYSFSGYKGRDDTNMAESGTVPLHRMHSYATTDSARGSGYEAKGRYAMDSGRRDGSFRTERGQTGSGYEKPSREMHMRSIADRDAALRKRRKKKLVILGALILLIIASSVIGLCAGLLTRKSHTEDAPSASSTQDGTTAATSTSAAPTATSTTYTLAACLSLFALSAPSAPRTYPCDQCLPIMQTADNDFAPSKNGNAGTSGNSTGIGAAVQFCGLQSIFANTDGVEPSRKRAGVLEGWMQNTNPCSGWSGIICDDKSRVKSLSLVFPGVPRSLDPSISGLVGLERIKIVGNSQIPEGPIPGAFFGPSLTAVEIQSTGLTSLGTSAFASLSSLTNLVLVSNTKLGSTLPPLPETLKLSTLSVTGQSLSSDPFPGLPASLTYIDLSYNALTGPMPNFGKFTVLESLFLDSNDFGNVPSAFPSSLRDLSLQNNPSLTGVLPPQLCSSSTLKTCELQNTSLGSANAMNTTTTQVAAIATRLLNATATTTLFATATAITKQTAQCGACRF